MKPRIVLDLLAVTILTIFVILNIVYFELYYIIGFVIMMIIYLCARVKYLFYKKFDYDSNENYLFFREVFCFFSVYVFEASNGKRYIDNGEFFSRDRNYKKIKLKFVKEEDTLRLNLMNCPHNIVLRVLGILNVVLFIIQGVVVYKGTSKELDSLLSMLFVSFVIFYTLMSCLAISIPGARVKHQRSRDAMFSLMSVGTNLNTFWFGMGKDFLVNQNNNRRIDSSNNSEYIHFIKSKYLEVYDG